MFIFFFGIYIHNTYRNNQFEKYGEIGEITGFSADQSETIIMFNVNGVNYKTYFLNTGYYFIGEKFKVRYSTKDPSVNDVLQSEPLFLNNEETSFTKGAIYRKVSGNIIIYKYEVNGVQYKKNLSCKSYIYENLKVGEVYQVEYLIDNPARSIMRTESPVTLQ